LVIGKSAVAIERQHNMNQDLNQTTTADEATRPKKRRREAPELTHETLPETALLKNTGAIEGATTVGQAGGAAS
jgi:hypothetical protein